LALLERALGFVRGVAEAGREVLFVGTKKQAQIPIAEQAIRSGQPYVAERYIGGMLTNFQTILPRIQYFKDLATRVEETPEEERSGKEWFALMREYQKLRRNFAGITEMERLPGALFVIDPKREELLVKEANRLKIPVIALTDTNCDPDVVNYVIPGNDDAIRAINLISRLMANAILEGRGEDEVPVEDRPVPPAVEEARVTEEAELSVAAETSTGTPNGSTEPEMAATEAPSSGVDRAEEPPSEEPPSEEPPSEEPPSEEPPSEEPPSEEAPSEEALAEEPTLEAEEAAEQATAEPEAPEPPEPEASAEPEAAAEPEVAEADVSDAGVSEPEAAAEPEAEEPERGEEAPSEVEDTEETEETQETEETKETEER
ncbi:MAG: 30S ribosomal protein S2, partial [Actinomycetota bacterium]|nr:30S ribosomal protein S2 [Actinomycetota bacterium]